MKKLIPILLLFLVTSCVNPLLDPSIKIHESVHSEYLEYIDKDSVLSEDSKRYRKDAIKTYGMLLDEVKNAPKK